MDSMRKCTHLAKPYIYKVNYLPELSNMTITYFFYVLNDEE